MEFFGQGLGLGHYLALGAALFAGLAVGMFKDLDDIRASWEIDATFEPQRGESWREQMRALWREGLARV